MSPHRALRGTGLRVMTPEESSTQYLARCRSRVLTTLRQSTLDADGWTVQSFDGAALIAGGKSLAAQGVVEMRLVLIVAADYPAYQFRLRPDFDG